MSTNTLTQHGEQVKSAAVKRATITFPADLWKQARRLAVDEDGITANDLVVEGLRRLLAARQKGEKAKRDAA